MGTLWHRCLQIFFLRVHTGQHAGTKPFTNLRDKIMLKWMALPIINVYSLDETIETKLGFLPEWQKKHNQLLKFQISLCVMIPPA